MCACTVQAEYATLAFLEPHPNIMRFYAQFVAPVPASVLPQLPAFVRETATLDASGRPRHRPLPCQWALFEWLPQTVSAWMQPRLRAVAGGTATLPWQEVAVVMLDVCTALEHLQQSHMFVTCRRCGHAPPPPRPDFVQLA